MKVTKVKDRSDVDVHINTDNITHIIRIEGTGGSKPIYRIYLSSDQVIDVYVDQIGFIGELFGLKKE